MTNTRLTLAAALAIAGLLAAGGSARAVSPPATQDGNTVQPPTQTPMVMLPDLPDLPDAAADAARSALDSALDHAMEALANNGAGDRTSGAPASVTLPELPESAADQARDALAAAQDLIDNSTGGSGNADDNASSDTHGPDNPHIPNR